jgi:hypothetical protein
LPDKIITIGRNAMRTVVVAISSVLMLGAVTPVLAAKVKAMDLHMAAMKAKDPQNFQACVGLARQRGFIQDETDLNRGLMMFIDGCIMGRQH